MEYVFIIIIIALLLTFLLNTGTTEENGKNDPELFSTQKFEHKESIKSAKCPQCGKMADTYKDIEEHFGLRKVGYTTDIQSWCRECRRDKDVENDDSFTEDNDLNLFNE